MILTDDRLGGAGRFSVVVRGGGRGSGPDGPGAPSIANFFSAAIF